MGTYPPPCVAVTSMRVRSTPPIFQTVPVGRGLSTFVPRSPCLAFLVALYAPALKHSVGVPPAIPHGSAIGPLPGALQGLNFQMSAMLPGSASRLTVRYFGSRAPGILSRLLGSKPAGRSWGQ